MATSAPATVLASGVDAMATHGAAVATRMLGFLNSSLQSPTLQRVGIGASAALVTLYVLGRMRLLPRKVAQLYWLALAPVWLSVGRLGVELTLLFGRLFGVSKFKRQCWANFWFAGCQAWQARSCGHLHVTMDAESRKVFDSIDTTKASVVLANHTSFADALLVSYHASWTYRIKVKVLYMASLVSWPVFGPCFKRCGHFPVYFAKPSADDFKVDPRQAEVGKRMTQHLKDGGTLFLFPEGSVNKTPETLRAFRHGTFRMLREAKVDAVYIMTCKGNMDMWPVGAPLGGFPADITMKMTRFDTRYDAETPEEMAERARQCMQAQLNTHP